MPTRQAEAASSVGKAVLQVEYIHRHTFATRTEARLKTATWIADFYNTKRRHSAVGGKPPVEFERIIQKARARTDQEGGAHNQRLYATRGLTGMRFRRARWARRTDCQFHDSRQVLLVGSTARVLDLDSGGSAARTTILATCRPQPSAVGETHTGLAPAHCGEVVRHLPSRAAGPPGCRPGPRVAQITATAIPPSRKR
ncbi:integrase core domain-containing protein [Streptomyces phaeochromogenes]